MCHKRFFFPFYFHLKCNLLWDNVGAYISLYVRVYCLIHIIFLLSKLIQKRYIILPGAQSQCCRNITKFIYIFLLHFNSIIIITSHVACTLFYIVIIFVCLCGYSWVDMCYLCVPTLATWGVGCIYSNGMEVSTSTIYMRPMQCIQDNML